MKRKAYEEAGLSVAQQPPSRMMPAAEPKLGPTSTANSQVTLAIPETMHLKSEKSAGSMLFFASCSFSVVNYFVFLQHLCLGRDSKFLETFASL